MPHQESEIGERKKKGLASIKILYNFHHTSLYIFVYERNTMYFDCRNTKCNPRKQLFVRLRHSVGESGIRVGSNCDWICRLYASLCISFEIHTKTKHFVHKTI